MTQIHLGHTDAGQIVNADLARLIDSRVLVQASSGAGKSWLLRLLCERCGTHAPLIVIDPEGEFATLREKLDMILVGAGGEIPANPRTAAMLARRLVESHASAVIDIYELELHHRREFVRQFLQATIDVPRSLWHPAFYVLDEAQMYCPEKGAGESCSTEAVISLMSLGRKRGFCGILATNRISKLHKDAAANANNVFTGRMTLDVDLKRACDSLGMGKNDWAVLKSLKDGEWFATGPALPPGVTKFRADQVETTHPKPGQRHKLRPPAPSASVRKIVGEMQDLANKDPDEALTLEEAQAIISRLKRDARIAAKAKIAPVQVAPDAKAIERAVASAVRERDQFHQPILRELGLANKILADKLAKIHGLSVLNGEMPKLETPPPAPSRTVVPVTPIQRTAIKREPKPSSGDGAELGKCERTVLQVLAQHGVSDLGRIARLAVYSSTSGGFRNSLSNLRTLGLIVGENTGTMEITDEGRAAAPSDPLPTGAELRAYWLQHRAFGASERKILSHLFEIYPDAASLEDIAEATGYEPTSGGFRNSLSNLRTASVIEGKNTEPMRASATLFE